MSEQLRGAIQGNHHRAAAPVLGFQGRGTAIPGDALLRRRAGKTVVPFAALTAFADPSIKFGLQFQRPEMPEVESHQRQTEIAAPEASPAD